jgi:hypothetical protein
MYALKLAARLLSLWWVPCNHYCSNLLWRACITSRGMTQPGIPLVPSGPGTPCWFAQTTGIVLGCLWDCAWLCPPHGPQAKGTTCWGHVHVGKACMQFAYCLKLLMSLITSQAKRFHDHSNGCSGANSIGHWKWTPGWQVWAHVHLVHQVHHLLGCP